jgi:hypothetical protein
MNTFQKSPLEQEREAVARTRAEQEGKATELIKAAFARSAISGASLPFATKNHHAAKPTPSRVQPAAADGGWIMKLAETPGALLLAACRLA